MPDCQEQEIVFNPMCLYVGMCVYAYIYIYICIHIYIYIYIYINSTSCYMKVSNLCVDSCLITGLPFHQTRHQNFSCSSPRSTSREKFFLAMFIMSLIVNIFSSKMYLITDTVNTGTLSVLL